MLKPSKDSQPRLYAFFVLYFLYEQGELSGYEIARTIKQRTRGYFSSTPGNIYPVLKNLEENGLIESKKPLGTRNKILYGITPQGRKVLVEMAATYKERFERITSFFDKVINDTLQ